MKNLYVIACLAFLCFVSININATGTSLFVVCEAGSVNGSRTEIDIKGNYKVEEDRVTLPTTIYGFDVPIKGKVTITIGENEIIGTVLNEYPTYKTVVYRLGGVSYMDTVFFTLGKVLSSEHKYLFIATATTWRLNCSSL